MTKYMIIAAVALFYSPRNATAQISRESPLFIELKKQDSVFFERGFNRCDMAYLERTVDQDLRFYHDKGGFQDREKFFDNIRRYICADLSKKPIRKVEQKSLEVYPLYNDGVLYAAIQSGVHYFYIREPGKEDLWTNVAKFTSVWILENQTWKLKEVLSYDHQDPVH